jgi:hypothetical protein
VIAVLLVSVKRHHGCSARRRLAGDAGSSRVSRGVRAAASV